MSARITEAMVEAAIPAYAYAANIDPNPHMEWLRPAIRAALEAAAALSTEPGETEGKPIAWLRPRDIARLSEASPGAINAQISNVNFQRWTVPVYAAPLPEDTHHGR